MLSSHLHPPARPNDRGTDRGSHRLRGRHERTGRLGSAVPGQQRQHGELERRQRPGAHGPDHATDAVVVELSQNQRGRASWGK